MISIQLIHGHLPFCQEVSQFFAEKGHLIEIFDKGQEAKSLLEAKHFDLVVTDLLMKDQDGLDFIQELRANNPQLKIMAYLGEDYCGLAHPDFLLDCSRFNGANKTLMAPYSLENILEEIQELLPVPHE